MKSLRGECLCGAVRFTVEDDFHYALNCHCSQCPRSTGAFVHVNLGALTDAPGLRPTAHIYVDSKAPWHTITDDLPQHGGLPE